MTSFRNDKPALLLLILIKGDQVQWLNTSPWQLAPSLLQQSLPPGPCQGLSAAARRMPAIWKWCWKEAGQAPFSTEHGLDLTWIVTSNICKTQLWFWRRQGDARSFMHKVKLVQVMLCCEVLCTWTLWGHKIKVVGNWSDLKNLLPTAVSVERSNARISGKPRCDLHPSYTNNTGMARCGDTQHLGEVWRRGREIMPLGQPREIAIARKRQSTWDFIRWDLGGCSCNAGSSGKRKLVTSAADENM